MIVSNIRLRQISFEASRKALCKCADVLLVYKTDLCVPRQYRLCPGFCSLCCFICCARSGSILSRACRTSCEQEEPCYERKENTYALPVHNYTFFLIKPTFSQFFCIHYYKRMIAQSVLSFTLICDPKASKNRSRFHGTAAGRNHRQKVCTDCRTKYTVSLFFIDGQTGLSLCEDKFSPQNPRRA